MKLNLRTITWIKKPATKEPPPSTPEKPEENKEEEIVGEFVFENVNPEEFENELEPKIKTQDDNESRELRGSGGIRKRAASIPTSEEKKTKKVKKNKQPDLDENVFVNRKALKFQVDRYKELLEKLKKNTKELRSYVLGGDDDYSREVSSLKKNINSLHFLFGEIDGILLDSAFNQDSN